MAKPINDDSSGHYDWFELTNDDTNTVNLQGYRLFDTPTFQGAFTITSPLFIRPGESIVFVEEMSAERFWRWWGHDNYSPDIQVCSYRGFSLGDLGEALFLWNPACIDPYDPLVTTSWAAATHGVSLECTTYCDPDYGCIGECLVDSIRCQNGTFAAAVNGDIGSPGRTSNPSPRILSITCEGTRVLLRCRVNVGRAYRLWCSPTLIGGTWVEVETRPASDCLLSLDVAGAETGSSRFYRLEELP
jgi:hypothetical protein